MKQSGVVCTCNREDLICILSINVLPKPKSDKLRLIIDGSPLKPYELRRRFKLEQIWKEGREIFAGCTHGSVIDISNAFFHIDIAEESKQYLGFEWGGEYYQFNSLPMGIHAAPFIFTEVTKPVVRHWRALLIQVLKYMDYFTGAAIGWQRQQLHAKYMVEHLRSLGWVVQNAKLQGIPEPLPEVFALGTIVSFSQQKFLLREDQLTEIMELIHDLRAARENPVSKLAKLAGLLISRAHCLGPATRMLTRALYDSIESQLNPHERGPSGNIGWNRYVNTSAEAVTVAELEFWRSNLRKLNGQPFLRAQIRRTLDVNVDTDAGSNGWGVVLYLPPQTPMATSLQQHWRSPAVICPAPCQSIAYPPHFEWVSRYAAPSQMQRRPRAPMSANS